jgi:transient receptor potential cation channel subfamily V protein 5
LIILTTKKTGQSALHMAIVNEDMMTVKYLLKLGANIHQRCVGRFFLPDDQKNRISSNGTEYPNVCVHTNYHGMSYFGEYPLSFATVLNLEHIVRLLLASGADVNKQDSNGNTALHMIIIHNNFVTLEIIY